MPYTLKCMVLYLCEGFLQHMLRLWGEKCVVKKQKTIKNWRIFSRWQPVNIFYLLLSERGPKKNWISLATWTKCLNRLLKTQYNSFLMLLPLYFSFISGICRHHISSRIPLFLVPKLLYSVTRINIMKLAASAETHLIL